MSASSFEALAGTAPVREAARLLGEAARSGTACEPVAPLLLAAASGDSAAWDTLVDRFSGLLWATARAHRLS